MLFFGGEIGVGEGVIVGIEERLGRRVILLSFIVGEGMITETSVWCKV